MTLKQRCKKTIILICIPIFFLFTSGCYDKIEVDEMVYVVSMGIDSGTNGNLRMTFLLSVPIAVGVGVEPGETDQLTTLITVEAPTLYGAMNLANSILSKRLNFSHAKLIIISSVLAEEGVEKFINAFIRFREFRPNMFFGISRGLAEEFLREIKPILEVNPAKYFELLMESYRYTGFITNSKLEDFYMQMECTCDQPVAVLLDVNKLNGTQAFQSVFTSGKMDKDMLKEGKFIAGEIPVVFDNKSNIMGLAVFRADRMVGELNGQETRLYLMVTGNLENAVYTLPEPLAEELSVSGTSITNINKRDYVALRISQARKPVIKVEMKDDIPSITIHVSLEGDILSVDSDKDYSTGQGLKELEELVSEHIREEMLSFMEKTRDVYNSDICATGKPMKKTFLLWEDWIRFEWMEKYKKAEFQVFSKVSIRRSGIVIKQVPVRHLKGEAK